VPIYGLSVEVSFTKLEGRRYQMAVTRERGPTLAPRQGPGYDDYLPHEAIHFLVEAELRLSGGVFGRIAAGRSNIFTTAEPSKRRRQGRLENKRRPTSEQKQEMARSERLAGVCSMLWEFRAGRRSDLPLWFASLDEHDLATAEVERVMDRLDDFAVRWHRLPVGGSISLSWPSR
jgi:hypothetical protein